VPITSATAAAAEADDGCRIFWQWGAVKTGDRRKRKPLSLS